MGNALYFPRYRHDESRYRDIIHIFALELDYSDELEKTYSSEDIMMTLSKKYAAFYFFTSSEEESLHRIERIIKSKGKAKNENT